ncbi:hypothetical protein BI291_05470 [Thalassotalea sp. PP2-459]|nr:hypothetical protein BI291_05470 [Thalassotalea sp. PP2-459]
MKRLLTLLSASIPDDIKLIVFTDSEHELNTSIKIQSSFLYPEARDKYSSWRTLSNIPKLFFYQIRDVILINRKYNVVGYVATGPGVSILPALLFKLMKVKVIGFESWSRFYQKSYTGKILYLISDMFFVQNKSLLRVYKNAAYKGRL